jgi:signal peptidase I
VALNHRVFLSVQLLTTGDCFSLSFPRLSGSLKIHAPAKRFREIRLTMKEENASETEAQSPVRQHPIAFELKSWLRDIVFAFAIAIFIVVFVVQPVRVEGTSMQPQLVDQERIFVNRFIYKFSDIHRSDIVVFWYPKDRTKSFIKRVVGVPGDTVEIQAGSVYVNGVRLDEPYLKPEFRDYKSFQRVVVPPGQYFVLGDHRNSSNDSRNWGFVARRLIYGKAVFSYWPFSRVGLVE